jgi:predicted dehydrogenase
MNPTRQCSRRAFLVRATASAFAATTVPTLIPATALGRGGAPAPSQRVVLGAIGTGDRGQDVLRHFLQQAECRVAAVCDVRRDMVEQAKALVDGRYQNRDCRAYADFRELLARPDIDAVLIASADHWHVPHALAAVRAGKDLYVEKPLGLSLEEDQILRREVLQRRRVFQFGTQQRSDRKFRLACELVRNGCIGTLKHVNVWSPGSEPGGSTRQVPVPATLDYDFWLGPAAWRPYTENLVAVGWAKRWWFVSDFAVGFIAGWGIHPMDIALWGAGDRASGKVEVEGTGTYPAEGICDTAAEWDVNFKFSTGLTLRFCGRPDGAKAPYPREQEWRQRYGAIETHGTAFEGTDGWVHVDRSRLQVHPESLLDLDPEKFAVKLTRSSDQVKSFLAAVQSRQATVSSIESAVRADAFCHVPDIALRLKRKLTYDVKAETFPGDDAANRRLRLRPMRPPWQVS